MTRNNLKKELLSDLIAGDTTERSSSDILDSEEVKAMMYHHWMNPNEVTGIKKPDYGKILDVIRSKTHPERSEQSPKMHFLISEITELKDFNRKLQRKIITSLAIAASVILLLSASGIYIISKNQVFRKTYTENIVPGGQKSTVILPDGTKVYLNSGSALRYDNFFGKKYRTLDLVGEGYFEVTHNEKLPFIINTEDIEVRVMGTKFNLMAYPEDDFVETIVTEGEVSVRENHGESSLMLKANQKATFHKDTRLLLLNDVNPEAYISWKDNLLTFDNENFSDVIKKLERWYDVKIQVQGTDSIKDRFTMTIKSESLREVLELISLTTEIDYKIQADQVTINYN
jgi:transmembrane sensor